MTCRFHHCSRVWSRYLIDIANLPDRPDENSVRTIRQRVERKNIVPLLRVNSTALARALD